MAKRGWTARIPIWVRVPGIIALVLVGVLVSTMVLGAARGSGGHGSSDQTRMNGGGHGPGDAGNHGAGGGGHGTGTHGR
jgi:hypothetical protein